MTTRLEHDLLGGLEVPADAYYGVHTARAVVNFPITGTPVGRYPELVRSLAAVKQAAALANVRLGVLDATVGDAVVRACEEIRAGHLHEQFVVDVVQGGAGTSTNMNANEVVANRALEILGHPRGRYDVVHPIDDVNRSQSTNDAYPTALRLALHEGVGELLAAAGRLSAAFRERAAEYRDVLKMGRTQLQEAVPMTLGQELGAWATMVEQDGRRLEETAALLREVNLGGTAIGTGLTAPAGFARLVVPALARISGVELHAAVDRIEATQGTGAFVALSGTLRAAAVKVSKICNDLRLLSSGPQAGLAEISLPPVQAGSSIMPGKVNPVVPEVVNQVAFLVVGRDVTVTMAAEAGQLQLNAFGPVIGVSLLDSLRQMRAAYDVLAERCVAGITANPARLRATVEGSVGLATALLPHLGYERATALARRSLEVGESVLAQVLEAGLLPGDWEKLALGPVEEVPAAAGQGHEHSRDGCPAGSAPA